MDKVALGLGFFKYFRITLSNIVPTALYNHLYLHVARTSRITGRRLGSLKKGNALSQIG
jgi:hypothetical protein